MRLRRPWLSLALAGFSWAHAALAQTGAGFGDPSGTTGGAPAGTTTGGTTSPATGGTTSGTTTNADGSKSEDTTGNPPANPPAKPPADQPADTTGKPPANPFGFDNPLPADNGLKRPGDTVIPNGASSNFGTGRQPTPAPSEDSSTTGTTGTKPKQDEGPTFSAPGFFGAGRQTFTGGTGRFAKPKYRYGASVGMGFDDNYNGTPDHTGQDPSEVTQVIPAQPEIAVFQPVKEQTGGFFFGGTFHPTYRITQRKIVLRPFQPEQTIVTPIPGVPMTPRASSIVTSANVYFNTQFAKPRAALTFDLRLGVEHYWDRKKDPNDYNGSLNLLYLRKLNARTQFTANASISHQTQPDNSLINVNNTSNGGRAYTNGFLKFDLSYRWGPRFSTDTSFSSQSVFYDKATTGAADNSFYDLTVGNEFRYIQSRKTTYVFELRYGVTRYLETEVLNSASTFVLVGLDQRWSSHLSSTVRIGESLRSFDTGTGGLQSSPYGELSVSYQPSARSQFGFNSRYGFEQTQTAGQTNITFRNSLSYNRVLSPRLTGTFSMNYVNSVVTTDGTNTSTTQNNADASLSFAYRFSRRFSLSSQLSYTMLTTNLGLQDYDRSRIFFTGTYDF